MAEFSSSFTGKGVTSRLSDNTQESYSGLADSIKEIEKIRYETFQKNRAEFLKNANVDPAFVLSNAARETQMKLIDNFNKKYGKLAQQKNYNLSTEDRLNMQTERNLIEAVKNEQLGQYELFKQHRDLVAKNPNRYDLDKFSEATDKYLESGRYDQTMPALKSLPFGLFIREQAKKMAGEYNPMRVVSGNQVAVATRNIQDIGKFIEDNMFVNDQATLGMLEDWDRQTPQEKAKWLEDVDKSGTIDQAEQENGIIKWAKQFYAKDAEVISYSPWKNIDTGGMTEAQKAKERAKIGVQDPSVPKTFGPEDNKRTYSPKSFHFEGGAIKDVSTNGGVALDKYGADDISAGAVDAELVLYDPVKKVFLIKSLKPSVSTGQPSNALIEIPEGNVRNFGSIPVAVDGQPEIKNIFDYNKYWSSSANPREQTQTPVKKKLY
jgi:hypothetical protein